MANIFSNQTATTMDPSSSTVQSEPSIKWTMKLRLSAAHQVLALLGVADALIAEADVDRWAKIYELLVGDPPPPKKPS